MNHYTSEHILAADDLYKLAEDAANLVPVYYRLTDGELEWLDFVKGHYAIADYVWENYEYFDNEDGEEMALLKIDAIELSRALNDDNGCLFAACLDKETALAKIFFWCWIEDEASE